MFQDEPPKSIDLPRKARSEAPVSVKTHDTISMMISTVIGALTKASSWTPGHIVISLSFLLWVIVQLLGGQEGITAILATGKETKESIDEMVQLQKSTLEALQKTQEKNIEQDLQIQLVSGLASELNGGKPNELWITSGTFNPPPAGQEHRLPKYTTQSAWK